jgi:hypothetical protein
MTEAGVSTERPARILVARHPTFKRHFYDVVFKWLLKHHPDLLKLFRVVEFPAVPADLSPYALHIPWLQDPVQSWSQETYDWANLIAAECDRCGIPIINRVDCLTNAQKFEGARLMRSVGILTPTMARIDDAEKFSETCMGVPLPLFVREDWGHWGKICRADTIEQARAIPLDEFVRPVAIEIIDVRDPRDGQYRKFRYIAAGDAGISKHMQVSAEWITRGENRAVTDAARDEEEAYITRLDPNHDAFQRARKAMGLDFVAFDYGYNRAGRLVAWEANAFPVLFSDESHSSLNQSIARTFCGIVAMYLRKAQLPVPEEIEKAVVYES